MQRWPAEPVIKAAAESDRLQLAGPRATMQFVWKQMTQQGLIERIMV